MAPMPHRFARSIRCTLLVPGAIGRVSMKTRTWGHLLGWRVSAANFWRVMRSILGTPGSGTMAHPTTSCSMSCGTEKARALRTRSCREIASSTSKGLMISPPLFMTSLVLPVRKSHPSASRYPVSPVTNHPPSTTGASSPSYPPIRGAPLTHTSPTLPGPRGRPVAGS